MKILIAAGGTAGHTIPALVVAEQLKKEDKKNDILFVISRNKQDISLVLNKGFKYKSILTGKLRRYFSILNFIDFFKVITGFFHSLYIILKFKPDVVFGKGSYVSLPVVYAGKLLAKKIIIHESDYSIGLANRLSLYVADKIAVSYPVNMYKKINPDKIFFSGNPLREMKVTEKQNSDIKTILVLGGSQGSRKINFAIAELLNDLLGRFNVIHQAGNLDIEELEKIKNNLSPEKIKRYTLFSNIYDENKLDNLYNEADLVISRSGSIIFEIAHFGKPAIVIPLPGHQEKNADFFQKNSAILMIKNEDLTAEKLKENILKILSNKQLALDLAKNISKFAPNKAASIITLEIIKLASK